MNASVDVLFVNPSLDEVMAILRALREGAHQVHSARVATAETMLQALHRQSWDVVIAELTMPQFGAVEAIKLLKQEHRDTSVIVVSSQGGEEAAVEVMRAGAKDFLRLENLGRLASVVARELAQGRLRRERRQIGLAFRAVEQRLHAIVANSPDAILLVSEAGTIAFANAAAHTTFGYTVNELLGQPVGLLAPPAQREAQWQSIRTCPKGPFELVGRHKDGREIPLEGCCSELLEEDKRFFVAILRDVTERKRTQKEQARLASFPMLNPNPITEVDVEGRLTYANAAAQQLFPDLMHRGCHHPWLADCAELARSCQEGHEPSAVREILIEGRWYQQNWYSLKSARIVRIYGLDITERKQAREELRRSEARYRMLFEAPRDAIFLMQGDRFVECNAATLTMFGCRREEILGQSPVRFSPACQPDGRPSAQKAPELIRRALSGESLYFEWRHCRLDGTEFDAEVGLNRIVMGEEVFLQAIVRDVTDHKKAQRALAEAEAKYRTLVEESLFGVYLIRDDRFAYVNPKMASIFGYSEPEILALPSVLDIVSPRHREMVRQNLQKRLAGESAAMQYAFRGLRKDGREIDVAIQGSIVPYEGKSAVIGSLYEIPERRWRGTYQPAAETASFDRK